MLDVSWAGAAVAHAVACGSHKALGSCRSQRLYRSVLADGCDDIQNVVRLWQDCLRELGMIRDGAI